MNISQKYELIAKINIIQKHERYIEIYELTCRTTGKSYVGQAVTHILNHGKYRRYGMERRFACHVSEAFSSKKNQCCYLNNAIRKYGADNFNLELLDVCYMADGDAIEEMYIIDRNTLSPNGYNLKLGTITTYLTLDARKRVSRGVQKYYAEKKYIRFDGLVIDESKKKSYVRPLRRDGKQYGYYVYIQGVKADFGGIHIKLEDSRNAAFQFIDNLIQKKSKK